MAMIYGEGEKAFARLQGEIIRAFDDDSIFAWETALHRQAPHSGQLLARSPENFAHAGNIVLGTEFAPFELTNSGLRFEVPLLKAPKYDTSSEFKALLNCRFKDDMSGTLALRLTRPEMSEQFHAITGSKWQLSPYAGRTGLLDNSRLAFIRSSMIASCERRQIQITRHPRPSRGAVFRLNLVRGANFPVGARIIQVYPSTGWDEDHSRFRTTLWNRIVAGVLYENRSGDRIALVFGYEYSWRHDRRQETASNADRPLLRARHYHSDIQSFANFCHSYGPYQPLTSELPESNWSTHPRRTFSTCTPVGIESETMVCRISMPEKNSFTVDVEITKLCELEAIPPRERAGGDAGLRAYVSRVLHLGRRPEDVER